MVDTFGVDCALKDGSMTGRDFLFIFRILYRDITWHRATVSIEEF